jgi:nucleoside-diphosphate-sugar epimerase
MVILITGGFSFIGHHLSQYLAQKGMEVVTVTRNVGKYSKRIDKEPFRCVEGDLADKGFLERVFREHRPEIVIHLAWCGVTGPDRNSPDQEKNLLINQNLLEMSGRGGSRLFIGFGSQGEYGVQNRRIDEQVLPTPHTLYGVYKLAAGLVGRLFAETYHFKYAWLRLFSTFGPGDHEYYVIPYVITSLLKGEPPRLTLCEQRWDYLYVKDIPPLVWRVINKEEDFCDIFNLCSGRSHVLKEIVLTITDCLGSSIEPVFGAIPYRKDGLFHLEGENRKFKDTFGWTGLTDLKNAMIETVAWFKDEYERGYKR